MTQDQTEVTVMDVPHARSASQVSTGLAADPRQGLTAAEARRRLTLHGPNRLRRQKPRSLWSILRHQFASVIVWLLAMAAALSMTMGDVAEAVAVLVVLVINGTIGFATELRAARSMEALGRIAQVQARVRRDGKDMMVPARDLVPGDLVELEAGDVVTADLRLIRVWHAMERY